MSCRVDPPRLRFARRRLLVGRRESWGNHGEWLPIPTNQHAYAPRRAGKLVISTCSGAEAPFGGCILDFSASLSNIGSSLTGYTGTSRYPSAPM